MPIPSRASEPEAPRIALVDDHTLIRETLAHALSASGGYVVTVQASNGVEFTERMRDAQVDIALIDLQMPVMDGYETLAWLAAHHPLVKAAVLTFDATEAALMRAVRLGARGYLLKDMDRARFEEALDALATTGYWLGPRSGKADEKAQAALPVVRKRAELLGTLTPREREVLYHLCAPDEPSYERIAERLGIARSTVQRHVDHICERHGLKGRVGMALLAAQLGLVDVWGRYSTTSR